MREVRKTVSKFINTYSENDVVITANAAEGVNAVMKSMGIFYW